MGKMKGDIYKYYMMKYDAKDPANSSPRLPKWECRFCSKQYVQNATKMRHHVLNMCEEIPAPLKLALLDIPNVSVNIHEDLAEDATKLFLNSLTMSTSGTDLSTKAQKKAFPRPMKKRKPISFTPPPSRSSVHPKITPTTSSYTAAASTNSAGTSVNTEQDSLHMLIARAIFSSSSSLSVLENPYWVDVFQRISPGISLPSKHTLETDLLEKEVSKIETEVEKCINEAKYVGLQCEAWVNNKSESMVTFVVTTPTPFSFRTYATGESNCNDAVIADCARKVIKDIESTNTEVLSFVSRTTDQMLASWTKIKAEFPKVFTFGCIIESLELLLQDILEEPRIGQVLNIVNTLTKKIKQTPAIRSKLESIHSQAFRLHSFNRSRPLSYIKSLESIQRAKEALKWIAEDEESLEDLSGECASVLSRESGLWARVDLIIKLLFPVIKWLNTMKERKPEISLVARALAEINCTFEETLEGTPWREELLPSLGLMLEKRKELCLQTIHLTANLLDPCEKGACLDPDQVLQATEFIDSFCELHQLDSGLVIAELSQFRMKTDFYSRPFLWKMTEKVRGSVWWSTLAPKSPLAELASAILSVSPCTCAIDPTTIPSGPTSSKDCKLVFVSHNLRIKSETLVVRDARCFAAKETSGGGVAVSAHSSGNNEMELKSRPSFHRNADWSFLEACYSQSDSDSEAEVKQNFVSDLSMIPS